MIRFRHAYKTFPNGTQALRDINFEIEKGEFVFLMGPSGAGKTTLFKLISAFDRPTTGSVEVAGSSVADLSAAEIPLFRRRIGVVYQDFRLLKDRSVFENVALPLIVRGDSPSTISRRVNEMLDEVSLLFKSDRLPSQLSGGEQQRVAIARALIHHPGVLIADEPTGNLDTQLAKDILDLLERVNAQGTTVFVATHDKELVKSKPARIINLKNGSLEEKSSLSEVSL
jgi:cell division transport system ATP-binding protein